MQQSAVDFDVFCFFFPDRSSIGFSPEVPEEKGLQSTQQMITSALLGVNSIQESVKTSCNR